MTWHFFCQSSNCWIKFCFLWASDCVSTDFFVFFIAFLFFLKSLLLYVIFMKFKWTFCRLICLQYPDMAMTTFHVVTLQSIWLPQCAVRNVTHIDSGLLQQIRNFELERAYNRELLESCGKLLYSILILELFLVIRCQRWWFLSFCVCFSSHKITKS